MNRQFCCFLAVWILAITAAQAWPAGEDSAADRLLEWGLLDLTKAPYLADPTGKEDSTEAIQRAVNDARDRGLVCFFPAGVYSISDTISCEQPVTKLDRPRNADGRTQHYWDVPQRIVLFGSGKGKRPLIRLAENATGFDDPNHPKFAIWIWAQTRDDALGKQEPIWGKEQPNISFNHVFKGIDIDVRGHAGAIGLRHSGSQGSSMLDCKVYAEGAYAGFSNCCGQGGGTYNVETVGGRYGITLESNSRFPILVGCKFTGQSVASVGYDGSIQVPTLLVGCQLEPDSDMAVDFTTPTAYAGINLVDCLITVHRGGVIAGTSKRENIHIENSHVRGAGAVARNGAPLPSSEDWTFIHRYSSTTPQGVHLTNGVASTDDVANWEAVAIAPSFESLRQRHYRQVPSFDEPGIVNVKEFGAQGDGQSDDSKAFQRAIAASDKVFVPKGSFRLSGRLQLGPDTHLFGLTRSFSSIGGDEKRGGRPGSSGGGGTRRGGRGTLKDQAEPGASPFTIVTVDDPDAAPGFSHLGVRGELEWRSGKGTSMLAAGLPTTFSANGGGQFYGVMNMRRPLVLEGITHPLSLYAFNVERVTANPQCIIRDCRNLRLFYFKVEAGTLGGTNAGDGNTPGSIRNCENVHVYCMYGNVRKLGSLPMLEVINSEDVAVSQLKAFQPGEFPHLLETYGKERNTIASSQTCALFLRESKTNAGQ